MENEIQDLLAELTILKGQILEAVQGLDDTTFNWHPVSKDSNSIYSILSHVIGAQNNWVHKIIDGQNIQRDRDAELRSSGKMEEIVNRFEGESREIEMILNRLSPAALEEARQVPSHPQSKATVRWCILHVLTHNAIHLGHIQLTRQLWEQNIA